MNPDNIISLKIAWWNINKRLYLLANPDVLDTSPFADKNFDIVFIFETNLGYSCTPKINNYTCFSNPKKAVVKHGGIAAYVKNDLAKNLMDIKYNNSYLSFRLDHSSNTLFAGIYVQPKSSKYFNISLFSEIDALLKDCKEHNFTPLIGGDFNARIGDINMISPWKYEKNCDSTTNKHGRLFFTDLCRHNKVYPLNHLISSNKTYHGDFTYIKANKKSQIDFILTIV